MKKRYKGERMPVEQVIAFLEETLLEEGYIMPREPSHITNEDLELYGKGKPLTLDELKHSVESQHKIPGHSEIESTDISNSLAMAARNGTSISDSVWDRMRLDRYNAEVQKKLHE